MTLLEAIDLRRSRRKYLPAPLDAQTKAALQALALEYSAQSGARIELAFDEPAAFDGLRKTYGLLVGVRNYAGLIARQGDQGAAERLGYYGELLMLHAVALGLGTCWVGGSFDRALCPFPLTGCEEIVCTIALGYTNERNNLRESLIYGATHRKRKTIEQMMSADAPAPDWFLAGMRAVQKAPSALNRQPVLFSWKGGAASAALGSVSTSSLLDLGIAKLHFELGAGGGAWDWGNGGAFTL
ncbi:MAG: nitroreductase family protein [Oscillospiraceae bacterium]|nr:nitroreductase family protein [Oscillospiraceae bacterium]